MADPGGSGPGGSGRPGGRQPEGALEARQVAVRFGGVSALRSVSLRFPTGIVHGLIGPNGAGKTTLFDALSGLTPVSDGRILLDGVDITNRSPTWRSRQGIRRTFQRQQTFGWLSVEDNLVCALEWHGGGGGLLGDLVNAPSRRRLEAARRQRVEEVLELCGLARVRSVPAGNLTIGRARIVEIARAIVDHPRILLLDEPTSGLEEREVKRVGQLIGQVRDTEGCGIVLVEHDIGFVMRECDTVAVLNLGEVLAIGTPAEVGNDESVMAAYLG
ncbi:MAG TPA: ABC transporter ATP-binding protein [Acidimicrobiales bacterium]|nr:ABC transporter ATP-binding protein [Acidimicrobiales bacterium]